MRLILKYLKEYKLEAVLAPLFKMLEAIFELFVPLVIARLIDKGISVSNKGIVIQCAMLLLGLAIIGLASSITAQYFAAKAAIGASKNLRFDLFKTIQSFSFSKIDKIGTNTMLTRLSSDLNLVQTGINMTLRLFLRSPFIVFGAMIMAFTIDVKSALIFAVTIPVLSVVVYGIMATSIPMYKAVQKKTDSILSITRENLSGLRVIRAFGIEKREMQEYEKRNNSLNALQKKVGSLSGLEGPLTFVIINAATLWLLYTGAVKVDGGILSQGQVVALVNYMSQILVELIKLANLIVTMSKGLAGADRIAEIISEGDEGKIEHDHKLCKQSAEGSMTENGVESGELNDSSYVDDDNAELCKPIFEFKNVFLKYDGNSEESLLNIDFSVYKGQTIGIVGGTGSGKSSLVNMLSGFYLPTSGTIEYKGVDIKGISRAELTSQISIVLQKAVLFRGTVAENLKFGKDNISDEELYEALRVAQAYDFVMQKDGLDTVVEQGGTNFSGGQKQRLHIARALVRKPEVLILDDSSSALDFATDAALRKAIHEYDKDCTLFIVSQRTASVALSDMIIVMDDGKIAGMGTHEELLLNCPLYREIHNV